MKYSLLRPSEEPPPSRATRTGVGQRQLWLSGGVTAFLLIGAAIATPFSDAPLTPVPGLLAVFSTAMVVINLLLAALLFIKGRVEDGRDTIRLGSAYLYVGLIIIPQTLSFPGALMPAPIIGTQATSLWFWVFWHVGFAVAVMRYAWSTGQSNAQDAGLARPIAQIALAVGILTYVAVAWAADLPALVVKGHFEFTGSGLAVHTVVAAATLAALLSVVRLRASKPEQLWLTVGLVASCVEVWLTLNSSARYALGWYLAKAGSLLTSVVVLLSLIHEITRLYSEAAMSNKALHTLARRDGLTGVSNRRHFDEMLAQEFLRARRQQLPLALIMVDVDMFKVFNDTYGHPAGDECLRRVAGAIRSSLLRPGDTLFRYGGEEFAVLLPATDAEGARVVAEAMRSAVAGLGMEHTGSSLGIVTISAGIGWIMPSGGSEAAADLVSMADHALYRAKEAGRNRVHVGTGLVAQSRRPVSVGA
jgi:diguanylate cyclase (GGDEF)-like protein